MAPIANNAKHPETVYTAQARTGLYTVIYGLNFKGDITIHVGGRYHYAVQGSHWDLFPRIIHDWMQWSRKRAPLRDFR